jgi:hypothetical protein
MKIVIAAATAKAKIVLMFLFIFFSPSLLFCDLLSSLTSEILPCFIFDVFICSLQERLPHTMPQP